MIRHKYIGKIDWDSNFFYDLKCKDYINEEYDYFKKVKTGSVYIAKHSESKEKFMSIASNCGNVWRSGRRLVKMSKTMYALTEAGAQYVMGLLIESKI